MNALNIIGLSGREQIPAEDIIYLEADINYTTIYTVGKTKHTMEFYTQKSRRAYCRFKLLEDQSWPEHQQKLPSKHQLLEKRGICDYE